MREPGIAVVGAGNWGRNLLRVYGELGALRAVCDADEEALARARALHPEVHATRNFDDLLEDPGVRGVVIALPASLHFQHAARALRAGKDVCVEKPLALEVAHARMLESLARQGDRVLMVGHLMRYHPAFLEMKARLEGGALGRIRWIESARRDPGASAPADAGPLWDLAPHDLSMVLALTGSDPHAVIPDDEGQVTSEGNASRFALAFSSGVRATISVSRTHPVKQRVLTVVTDRARLVFDDMEAWDRKLALHAAPGRGGEPADDGPEYVDLVPREPLREECRHFLDCLGTRKSPLTDGKEAIRVLEVLERVSGSVDAGGEPVWGQGGRGASNDPVCDAFVPW
jgi:UDP-2-acetamido-3-amino-2,3-dideoxy-glucuronate N-acetyltransferase